MRNIERFPEDFMFQLTLEECLRSQIATLNQAQGKHLKYLPFAFTENGIAMLSSVLRSEWRIVLIDNYIDDTVLTLMSKRASEVKATIYTGNISKQLQLDIDKHNAQYPPIEVRTFSKAHERRRRMWGRCPIGGGHDEDEGESGHDGRGREREKVSKTPVDNFLC